MILVRFHWTNPAPGAARWEQVLVENRYTTGLTESPLRSAP